MMPRPLRSRRCSLHARPASDPGPQSSCPMNKATVDAHTAPGRSTASSPARSEGVCSPNARETWGHATSRGAGDGLRTAFRNEAILHKTRAQNFVTNQARTPVQVHPRKARIRWTKAKGAKLRCDVGVLGADRQEGEPPNSHPPLSRATASTNPRRDARGLKETVPLQMRAARSLCRCPLSRLRMRWCTTPK